MSLDSFPELKAVFDALRVEQAALDVTLAPLYAEREALIEQMRPLEAAIRAIDEQISPYRPRIAEVCGQISVLARSAGGRHMGQNVE